MFIYSAFYAQIGSSSFFIEKNGKRTILNHIIVSFTCKNILLFLSNKSNVSLVLHICLLKTRTYMQTGLRVLN